MEKVGRFFLVCFLLSLSFPAVVVDPHTKLQRHKYFVSLNKYFIIFGGEEIGTKEEVETSVRLSDSVKP